MVSSTASSGAVFLDSGANLTTGSAGDVNQNNAVFAANPAMTAFAIDKNNLKGGLRTTLWSSGGYFEFGPVENLQENINKITDTLSKENLTLDEATSLQQDANDILAKIGNQGYFQGGGLVHFPIFPVTIDSMGGAIVFDFNSSFLGYGRVLDAPVELNLINNSIGTASSIYLKGAVVNELSMSYSRHIIEAFGGSVYAGLKAKLISASLTKSVMKFESLADSSSAGDDLLNQLTGANLNKSTGFGIDVGVIYALDNMHFGVTISNLNSPSFAYGAIGGDCSTLTGLDQTNCNAANSFANEISLNETHIMNAQTTIEAGYDTSAKGWRILASADVNATTDPVGNLIQNVDLSISDIDKDGYVFSGLRMGATKNLQGSQLTWLSFGASIWDIVQWDISFPLESVKVDAYTIPRGIKGTFGLEVSF